MDYDTTLSITEIGKKLTSKATVKSKIYDTGKTRINMLFFFAVLLTITAWWFGLMIESINRHRAYQANTVKNKRVRSFVHLARMAFRHEPELLDWWLFQKTISDLQQQYLSFIECGMLKCSK